MLSCVFLLRFLQILSSFHTSVSASAFFSSNCRRRRFFGTPAVFYFSQMSFYVIVLLTVDNGDRWRRQQQATFTIPHRFSFDTPLSVDPGQSCEVPSGFALPSYCSSLRPLFLIFFVAAIGIILLVFSRYGTQIRETSETTSSCDRCGRCYRLLNWRKHQRTKRIYDIYIYHIYIYIHAEVRQKSVKRF